MSNSKSFDLTRATFSGGSTAKTGRAGVEALNFDKSLVLAFERVAVKFSSRLALGTNAWRPTYRELNETANRLAHRLVTNGVAPGDRVAILMLHDAPQVAAALAILKAGAIVVVLDPADPPSRIKVLFEDAEPRIVITDMQNRSLAAPLENPGCQILKFESEAAAGTVENLRIGIAPEQTAFLTYTSGTTGRPKGVMKSHRQLRRTAAVHTEAMQYTENDRIPLFAAVSTGQGATALWLLLNGAMLCPYALKTRGIAGLADWIIARKLTVYVSSASIFRALTKTLDDRLIFANVRAVRLASEAVTGDELNKYRKHFPGTCIFVHTLSSSETSNIAWSRWSPDDRIPKGALPVGHFSRDMEVSLVSDDGELVPTGEIGEIIVKSRYLANGYWRDPKLTNERFSAPLDSLGTRRFRTGDRGRLNAEGLLEYCGRKDDRVKIRGNRIELLEVERAIEGLPGIDRAAVVVVARDNHEPMLAAFVVRNGHASLTTSRLRHAMRARLPFHMVPSRIVFLDALPYNKGNKIDREALRANFLPVHSSSMVTRPQTNTEMLVADIWAEIFDRPLVSRDDDFFNLGGDSLCGAIVAARIHASLGVSLSLQDTTNYPTVVTLASFIDDCRRVGPSGVSPIVPVPRTAFMPSSFIQEVIWRHREHRIAFSSVNVRRIIGSLNIEILKDCLNHLIGRHEILRTTFGRAGKGVTQIIHPSAPFDFSLIDLVDVDDPEGQADLILAQNDSQKIDLEALPLLRHLLIRTEHDHYLLARIFSAAILDGFSFRILNTELAILYEARLQKIESPLPTTQPLQFADYAAWQRQVMYPEGAYFDKEINWWKGVVPAALPEIRLPFRRLKPRTGLDPTEGFIQWSVSEQVSERLDQFARSVGTTHFIVRFAIFAALVADVAETSTVVIGTSFDCRNSVDTQNIVGPLLNTTPLILSCDPTKTFREWLAIVRDRVYETRAHSEVSYEHIKQQLRKEGIAPPEIHIVFVMAPDHSDQHFGDLVISTKRAPVGQMPWGCQFFIVEQKLENCRLNFDAGLYDQREMRAMLDRYLRLLEITSRHPELPIGELQAMIGSKPLHWRRRNYAERVYQSSPLLKTLWRRMRRR